MFCHKDKPVCKVVRCKLCRLRWLVPVFIFLMVCNFERIQQQDWRRPVEHFYRVDLYNHWLSKNRCHFVTISFHGNAFIGLLRSTKKTRKFYGRTFAIRENCLFSQFSEIPLPIIFFKIFVHFPFQVPKAITKKNHGVTELAFKLFNP